MFSCEPKRSIYVDGHLFWFWSQQCNSCKLQLHKRKYMNTWISKGETRFYLQDTTQRSTLSCLVIFCFTAVLRTKAIFSKICVPCDIKHRLQTMWNDLFLVLLTVVVKGDFSFSQAWEGGHMKQGRRPAKVWISNVCPQFYPDVRCENLILNFGLKSFTLFLGHKV